MFQLPLVFFVVFSKININSIFAEKQVPDKIDVYLNSAFFIDEVSYASVAMRRT